MHCYVYASQRQPETYVWTREPAAVTELPQELNQLLGELRLVLETTLGEGRRLPHADPAMVLAELRRQGWYLQRPPAQPPLTTGS